MINIHINTSTQQIYDLQSSKTGEKSQRSIVTWSMRDFWVRIGGSNWILVYLGKWGDK